MLPRYQVCTIKIYQVYTIKLSRFMGEDLGTFYAFHTPDILKCETILLKGCVVIIIYLDYLNSKWQQIMIYAKVKT